MTKKDEESIASDLVATTVTLFVIGIVFLGYYIFHEDVDSSPVREMHHDEVVTIVDSILDARFDAGCYPEDDDISVPHDSLGRVIMPKDWQ